MKRGWIKASLLLSLAGALPLEAEDTGLAKGAAAYLDFSFGARATAMGQAQTAVRPEEASVLHANPAMLALLSSHSLSTTTGLLGLDRSLYFAGYAVPFRHRRRKDDIDAETDPDLVDPKRPSKRSLQRPASSESEPHQSAKKSSEFDTSLDLVLGALNEFDGEPAKERTSSRSEEAYWNRAFAPTKHIDMTLAVGMTVFGIRNIEGRSEFGAPEATFQNSERVIYLSYAARLYENFTFGLSGKYLGQTLQSARANGFGFDAGAWYGVPYVSRGKLDIAMAVRDIGSKLKWTVDDPYLGSEFSYDEPVLMKLVFGAAYITPAQNWLLALDLHKAQDQTVRAHPGVEWRKLEHWRLRGGLNAYNPSMGFGFDWNFGATHLKMDYAFTYDLNSLVNPHWITLSLEFLPSR